MTTWALSTLSRAPLRDLQPCLLALVPHSSIFASFRFATRLFPISPASCCCLSLQHAKKGKKSKQTNAQKTVSIHQRINNSCFSSRRSRPLPHSLSLSLSTSLHLSTSLATSLSPSLWPPLSPPLHLASLLINAAVLERRAEDREADSRAVAGPDCDIRAAEPGRGAALGMRRRH